MERGTLEQAVDSPTTVKYNTFEMQIEINEKPNTNSTNNQGAVNDLNDASNIDVVLGNRVGKE